MGQLQKFSERNYHIIVIIMSSCLAEIRWFLSPVSCLRFLFPPFPLYVVITKYLGLKRQMAPEISSCSFRLALTRTLLATLRRAFTTPEISAQCLHILAKYVGSLFQS